VPGPSEAEFAIEYYLLREKKGWSNLWQKFDFGWKIEMSSAAVEGCTGDGQVRG